MSDKEIVLNTLNRLKDVKGHLDIKSCWESLNIDNDSQIRIKIKLEDNNLATPHIYNPWDLMITTPGLKVKSNDLNSDGNLKKVTIDKEFRRGVITTLIGVFVGFLLTFALEVMKVKLLTEPKETIVLPKIQLVHDTIKVPLQHVIDEKRNVIDKK